MKKRKWQNKARLRFMRASRYDTAMEPKIGSIQSSLDALNVQLGNLTSLSGRLECIDTFTKERLAAKSRDNLRIENLKKLFRLIYGNHKFVATIEVGENIGEALASIQRRLSFLKSSCERILNDEGVRLIVPSYNDQVSDSEHRIVQVVASQNSEDQAGHVAECLEIGFAVHGVITPAEVTVFAAESNTNQTNNPQTNN